MFSNQDWTGGYKLRSTNPAVFSNTTNTAAPKTKGTVPKYMLNTDISNTGIYFGMKTYWWKFWKKYSVGKPANYEGHGATIGGSGSGKSAGNVIPTIIDSWNAPFVTIDIKGELKREYDKKQHSRESKTFNLSGASGEFSNYDPFYFIYQDDKNNKVQNVRELANALISLSPDIRDPFWIKSTQSFLTGCILFFLETGLIFSDTMIMITTTPINDLINMIAQSDNTQAKVFVNHFIAATKLDESQMLTGILQEVINSLCVFATDNNVINALTPSQNQIQMGGHRQV
jgi:type IV secretion system protein VirD4